MANRTFWIKLGLFLFIGEGACQGKLWKRICVVEGFMTCMKYPCENPPFLEGIFYGKPSLAPGLIYNTGSHSRDILYGTSTCGTISNPRDKRQSSLRVINGKRIAKGEYTFLVTVIYKGEVVCTGTIIDPTHVMTAAHCIAGTKAKDWKVGVAELDYTKKDGEKIILVTKIKQHHMYNANRIAHDISILTLARPITGMRNAEPICLPKGGMQVTEQEEMHCRWMGSYIYKYPTAARDARVNAYDGFKCPYKYYRPSDKWRQICASGQSNICSGDSGGPLACKYRSRWIQCGISSYTGEICNEPKTNSLFVKVPSYMKWIRSVLGKLPE